MTQPTVPSTKLEAMAEKLLKPPTISDPVADVLFRRTGLTQEVTLKLAAQVNELFAAELRALLASQEPAAEPIAGKMVGEQGEALQQEQIALEDGTWTVTIKDGNHLQITDAKGRNRHHSVGQMSTGIHFAMTMAKQPFESSEQLDRILQATAKKFADPSAPAEPATGEKDLPDAPGRWTREDGEFDLLVKPVIGGFFYAGFGNSGGTYTGCIYSDPSRTTLPRNGWLKAGLGEEERRELERLRAEQQEALDLNNEMKRLLDSACDQRNKAEAALAAANEARQKAEQERDRLKLALSKQQDEIQQILGKAMGYPKFADDQKNFPGATGDDVCVGDHVAESLADEAASEITRLTAALAEARKAGEVIRGGAGVVLPAGSWAIWHEGPTIKSWNRISSGQWTLPHDNEIAYRLPDSLPSPAAGKAHKPTRRERIIAEIPTAEELETLIATPPAAEPAKGEHGKRLPQAVLSMCKARDWSLHWTARGAYLHLESSELIEAIRGKHGKPCEEAADVLIVLMSITEHAGIPWDDVEEAASFKVWQMQTKPPYKGESKASGDILIDEREGKRE